MSLGSRRGLLVKGWVLKRHAPQIVIVRSLRRGDPEMVVVWALDCRASLAMTESRSGNDRYRSNWDLSGARAASVADFLIERGGVPRERMVVRGMADIKPLAPNDTREGRAKNRRIEVIVSPNLNELFEIISND